MYKALILRHFDLNKQCFVKTDSSDYVNRGVLSQPNSNSILHPITYSFQRISSTKCNYKIYNKELLTIIQCFKE